MACEGWLTKEGAFAFSRASKRYFCLKGMTITIYVEPEKQTLKDTLKLDDAIFTTDFEKLVLEIIGGQLKRAYVLHADTAEDLMMWKRGLSAVIPCGDEMTAGPSSPAASRAAAPAPARAAPPRQAQISPAANPKPTTREVEPGLRSFGDKMVAARAKARDAKIKKLMKEVRRWPSRLHALHPPSRHPAIPFLSSFTHCRV